MKRRLAVVAFVVAVGVLFPASADAQIPNPFGDCKTAPIPERPDSGMASFFGAKPPDPLPAGDPFAKQQSGETKVLAWLLHVLFGTPPPNPDVSIVGIYGWGGLTLHTYDLGCGPSAARDTGAFSSTQIANWINAAPLVLTQVVGQVSATASNPSWLGVLDAPLQTVASAVRAKPFATLFPMTVMAVGLVVVSRSRRGSLADAASTVMWLLVVTVSAVVLLAAPLKAVGWFDSGVTWATGKAKEAGGANLGPLGDIGPTHEATLYTTWLNGTFGSADSPTAKEFGPRLFEAGAITWAEDAQASKDPEYAKKLVEGKQDRWKKVAAEIEARDPYAYSHLQGKQGTSRITFSALGLLYSYAALLFLTVAAFVVIRAFFAARVFVMAWPVVSIVGAFPSQRHHLTGLWKSTVGHVVNAAMVTFAAGLYSLLLGAILQAPGTSTFVRLLLIAGLSWAVWSMLGPRIPGGRAMRSIGRRALDIGTIAAGTALGNAATAPDAPNPPAEPQAPPPPAETWTPQPALPSPRAATVKRHRALPTGAAAGETRAAQRRTEPAWKSTVIDTEPVSDEDGGIIYVPRPRETV